jgi:hypothetical protein
MRKNFATFEWPTGAKINLEKIICIGALDKDEYNNIFIPTYVTGMDKPIKFIVSNSNGMTPENEKMRVKNLLRNFITAWETYNRQKE